jgi:guanylate kinase
MSNSSFNSLTFSPLLFCFVGPVACGKSTICQYLVNQDPKLMLSISTTTRPPRVGEVDGIHYHFVSKDEFALRVSQNKFIEWANIGSESYGTELLNISTAKAKKLDLILDIDFQGLQNLKHLFPLQVHSIFVRPPSMEVLKQRLDSRIGDSPERVIERLKIAEVEMQKLSAPGVSDYQIINDILSDSFLLATEIIQSVRKIAER